MMSPHLHRHLLLCDLLLEKGGRVHLLRLGLLLLLLLLLLLGALLSIFQCKVAHLLLNFQRSSSSSSSSISSSISTSNITAF